MKILIIEDDATNRQYLSKGFSEQGYVVDCAEDGQQGLMLATSESYRLIVLDRMLPKLEGLALLAALRATGNTTPVVILSALGDVDERIKGLRAGGDDYMVKPFSFAELLIRAQRLMERPSNDSRPSQLSLANLHLDLLAHKARVDDHTMTLQPKEFQLLRFLLEHQGQLLTRTLLFESVWDYHFDPGTNVIDVHIARLRKKLQEAGARVHIETVRGAGYRIGPAT
ncbi:two component transcriptional regulator, winged helix family [Ferrimonas balearica DSM 9799]|uniref:Two component transcriptional regulator, winged helix family n=1 Tax=Ferrimonas balearica (strain DSM 9799 / CCM 4581 / KCTC 23876 / PAT) TaxID=550540 RepID=E1SQF1_FERBD|nr:response regulator transcription factor [Ferrimonas balearica]ADN77922.1 two component transcriptional regulator, winged helix family [Ferrimonas balearica DSM 9799]MBW3141387.1 response regulator transcription factor [Ferrimonas balearica]MBW3166447.1 response regulator transcription factor [Ferrimonas balearica]MBY6096598.1 response regulator transcription factor [Ferrimonas balearica]MBY6108431.1 response regulator transcription factor [Ferrimonas balearica]